MTEAFSRALELLRVRDHERALPFAQQAVREDADGFENWCALSAALNGVRRPAEALDAVQRALALEPSSEWAHRLRSLALDNLGRRSEAIAAAREAVRVSPSEPHAWALLGYTAARLGYPDEARIAAERAVELDGDVHRWLALAYACMEVDWAEALRASQRALELEPENPTALNQLGWVHLSQGRFRTARDLFDRAILVDPDGAMWLFNRAIATGHLDGREAGTAEFRKVRELVLAQAERQLRDNPRNARSHADRSQMLRGLDADSSLVLESASRAVSLDPRLVFGWTQLREAAAASGRWHLARYATRRAVEVDPGVPDLWLSAADVALHAGRPAEAADWANRVVNEAPESRAFIIAKAFLCYAAGEFEDALALAREDLARPRLSCCQRVFVAACCLELGDEPAAREALEQAEIHRPTCGCFRRRHVYRLLEAA